MGWFGPVVVGYGFDFFGAQVWFPLARFWFVLFFCLLRVVSGVLGFFYSWKFAVFVFVLVCVRAFS